MGYGYGASWAWGLLGFLFSVLVIVAIVVLVLLAVRLVRSGSHPAPPMSGPGMGPPGQPGMGAAPSPYGPGPGPYGPAAGAGPGMTPARQILDERFARGEIGADEYHELRRHLEG
ncbi:SHOCT domain-containing protein [Georgenia thermotolerans]|uniref:SHOCT domain-containing protein n=2 Tax=Georgenia thermotolerans TaxID=527326 RepID=A0A7J5URM1_9MICO|nr:SHOCT domain-containing protein [Georgenia thermotolerans]